VTVGERCHFTGVGGWVGGLARFPIRAKVELAGQRMPMRPLVGVRARGKPQQDELGGGRMSSVRRVSSSRASPEILGVLGKTIYGVPSLHKVMFICSLI
jgi:hypothetical protein